MPKKDKGKVNRFDMILVYCVGFLKMCSSWWRKKSVIDNASNHRTYAISENKNKPLINRVPGFHNICRDFH